MKKNISLFFVCVSAALFSTAICCSTKNDYHYNVIDCKEPQIHALGDYILEKLKKNQRDIIKGSTCYDDGIKFLRAAPFASADSSYDGRRRAAVWMYKLKNEKGAVFGGVEETIKALETGNSWNILVDKKFAVHRYILRNSTDGTITSVYLSEEQLMEKVTNEMYWNHQDVLDCENFLFYLSKEFGNSMISFTIVNKENSNQEMRFASYSTGIGGFYKLENGDEKNDK